ncbi:MAG: hypothetical protein HKN67_04790 [Saprospiraceae bacterium]|nr:hypothetical protein [Bacteroidia bacterium]MBT8230385.1 hypothetical protein [Bacteroidia bacterium]NNF21235.1 hypothetical protein [Saprospiraceae bacterium]NNK90620.1 hypothetical protein [Saprospiraceae bacterium]
MSDFDEIIIGEFFPQPVTGNKTFVSVYAHHPIHGEVSLINEQENLNLKEVFDLISEGDAIELEVSDLDSGKYLARIMIGDNEFYRVILIDHG